KKKTDSESSPKTKPSQASKGKRIKTSATGEKAPKSKATKKKTDSESSPKTKPSQASNGDGVDILSKVPNAQQQTGSGTNEGAGEDEEEDEEHDSDDDNNDNDDKDDDQENDIQRTESDNEGDDFVHPNLSTYIADDQEKEKEEEKADDMTSDQKVSTPPDYELTKEDENQEDDDTIGEDQEDEENGELYGDLNLNLDRQDVEMMDAQTNQEMEEAHVTLTTEPPVVQQQSSSVSSNLVAKFINPSLNTSIDSILNPNVAVSVIPSFATIIPQTPIPIIQPQQQTHDSTTTTTIPTTTALFDKCLCSKNLYRALLQVYNSDKDIFSSYGDVVTLKRGRDDQDKDEEPSAGSNRGSKRQRSSKEESSKEASLFKKRSMIQGLMIWKNHFIKSSIQEMMMYLLSERQQMLMNDCGIHLALKLLIENGTKQRWLTTDLLNSG
ncbi:hypothetical protein Tco_1454500, partial [Tanacetum coccineum]